MVFDEELADQLLAVEKRLRLGTWGSDAHSQKLTCTFNASHAFINRLSMKITVSRGSLDKVTFALLLGRSGHTQKTRIYALDVNPTAPHSNGPKPGHPHGGRIWKPGETHEHLHANRLHDARPDGFATPPSEPISNFSEAAAYIYGKLNITPPPHIPAPGQGTLL